jgi:hypothetical protein
MPLAHAIQQNSDIARKISCFLEVSEVKTLKEGG